MYKKGTHISNKEHIQFNRKQVFFSFHPPNYNLCLVRQAYICNRQFFSLEKKLKNYDNLT